MCRPYGWIFGFKILSTGVPFSADFHQTWVDLRETGKKLSKKGSFTSKLITKVGMTATVGN